MAKEQQQTPSRFKRWRERLKLRNERARDISTRVGTARRGQPGGRPGGHGDGPGIGGGF